MVYIYKAFYYIIILQLCSCKCRAIDFVQRTIYLFTYFTYRMPMYAYVCLCTPMCAYVRLCMPMYAM